MEKLPLIKPIERCKSENEIWNTFIDPVLDPLVTNIEEGVHLRWSNLNDTEQGPERPDSAISVLVQSNWGKNLGYGEAKIAEPTDNKFMLAWDLCRLGYFSKENINNNNNEASVSFQIKGHAMTLYVTKLKSDGIYTMFEFGKVDVPESAETLETLTNQKSLQTLIEISFMIEKIRKQKKRKRSCLFLKKKIWPWTRPVKGINIRTKR